RRCILCLPSVWRLLRRAVVFYHLAASGFHVLTRLLLRGEFPGFRRSAWGGGAFRGFLVDGNFVIRRAFIGRDDVVTHLGTYAASGSAVWDIRRSARGGRRGANFLHASVARARSRAAPRHSVTGCAAAASHDTAGSATAASRATSSRVRRLNSKRRAALEALHALHLRHGVRVQRLGDLRSDDKDQLCFILLERLRFEQVPQDGNVGDDWDLR